MKRSACLLLLSVLLHGAATVGTIADITGDGAAHAFSGTALLARKIDVTALSTNSASCRVGDSNVGASRGQVIAAGGSYQFPPLQTPGYRLVDQRYNLADIYYFCGNGDKLTVIYVQ